MKLTQAQKRAIYYRERARKLEKIRAAGLWPEYEKIRGRKNEQIARFEKLKGLKL